MPSTRVLPVNCMSFVSALIGRVTTIKVFPILDHTGRGKKLSGLGNIVQHGRLQGFHVREALFFTQAIDEDRLHWAVRSLPSDLRDLSDLEADRADDPPT